ncbi:tetratricopeptide repeat protein [Thiohalocapsa marina]|uniref:Tetratricopeptide repeat protein n=1 Tax=Thiohalocapsa marina TaxID=424902 RepID=A0A5M8FSS7_9GAMM|nr:tetratricopeptide repeat protein [Thiohalocapsa marina]KAA6185822.1 tetratricopeptide repeat protein [Thiohalocapsa marina]
MPKTPSNITAACAILLVASLATSPSVSLAAEQSSPSVAALVRQAETQLQQQDIEGAIATLRQAIDLEPDSAVAQTRLGGALLLAQRHDAAIAQFRQAIAIPAVPDSARAPAFIGLAFAYLHTQRPALAKAALVEARRLDPGKAPEIDQAIQRIDRRAAAPPH